MEPIEYGIAYNDRTYNGNGPRVRVRDGLDRT